MYVISIVDFRLYLKMYILTSHDMLEVKAVRYLSLLCVFTTLMQEKNEYIEHVVKVTNSTLIVRETEEIH